MLFLTETAAFLLGAAQPAWWGYAYQYGVGGAVFLIGVAVAVTTKQIDLGTRRGRKYLALLLAGMVFLAGLHAVLQFVLPEIGS